MCLSLHIAYVPGIHMCTKAIKWECYTYLSHCIKLSQQIGNGVGSCSALGGHCTLLGYNFYGENYIPMEGHQKLGGHQPPLPPWFLRL